LLLNWCNCDAIGGSGPLDVTVKHRSCLNDQCGRVRELEDGRRGKVLSEISHRMSRVGLLSLNKNRQFCDLRVPHSIFENDEVERFFRQGLRHEKNQWHPSKPLTGKHRNCKDREPHQGDLPEVTASQGRGVGGLSCAGRRYQLCGQQN
jgi:hypothetical protein